MRSSKSLFIIALIAVALTISVGYASLTTNIQGNRRVYEAIDWKVKITKVETTSVTGNAIAGNPSFTSNSATFAADLQQPGDSVTYTITIVNNGNITVNLDNVNLSEVGSEVPEVMYTSTTPALTLAPGETTTMTVTAFYDSNYVGPTSVVESPKQVTSTITYVEAK